MEKINILDCQIYRLKQIVKKMIIPRALKSLDQVNISPVFIIGTNRCGSSIVSYLMGQHPQLEGLFKGPISPERIKNEHFVGYCESGHIWPFLLGAEAGLPMKKKGHRPLWGHPKYISDYYRDAPESEKEALLLANAVQKHRKTDKTPLIKDQLNILRIGLVRGVFHNAKFIIVIRDYPDYIKSGHHKWYNKHIKPSIGIHWLTLNNLALFELESFAPEAYDIILYRDLFDKKRLEEVLQSVLIRLNLSPFEFNLSDVSSQYRYLKSEVQREDFNFNLPVEIAKKEKLLLQRY